MDDLEQLSAKATQGVWITSDWQKDDGPNPTTICRARKEELRPGKTSIWPDGIVLDRVADCEGGYNPIEDAAFITTLVNAYRAGELVHATTLAAKDAEIARLKEALTPSGNTKAAYHGDFKFQIALRDEDGEEYSHDVFVPWTTVKEIMKAIKARATGADHD